MVLDIGPAVGTRAIDFTLPNESGREIRLGDYLGQVVFLAFYPSDFGVMCTVEIRSLKERYDEIKQLCVLLPISTNTTYSHGAFSTAHELPFMLLSDYDGTVCKLYDMYAPEDDGFLGGGRAFRAVFLIDQEGIVRYRWVPDDPGQEVLWDEVMDKLYELNGRQRP